MTKETEANSASDDEISMYVCMYVCRLLISSSNT